MPRAARLALLLCSSLLVGTGPAMAQAAKARNPKEAAFLKENDKAMADMMAAMNVSPTGDIDRDFLLMMMPHHQGAIDMARALLKYGKSEKLKALARTIIAKQTEEIAYMRKLAGPVPAASKPADMAMGHMHHGM